MNVQKVLIIRGHPRRESFSDALADSYERGACDAGMEVRTITVSELDFDPDVHVKEPKDQTFEPDLLWARGLLQWADHLVFVYPTWWGTVPARLKGFLDRLLTSGFAFEFEHPRDVIQWKQLLQGKTAQLITTRDTPRWVYRWLYGKPGHNAMRYATLGFCGVKPVRIASFGPVRSSTEDERREWLDAVYQEGRKLETGVRSAWERVKDRAIPWLKALRLQFYPMTWLAYTVGAFGGSMFQGTFNGSAYWIGYLYLFLIEAATVFTNEYYDQDTDRANTQYGPFTGGSRVLIDGALSPTQLYRAAVGCVCGAFVAGGITLSIAGGASGPLLGILGVTAVLGLGYTVPPLQLSYRGLGELTVAVTHSVLIVVAGFVVQGGTWTSPWPWLVSVPLFLAMLAAITLAGVPDRLPDKASGKRTWTVRMGTRASMYIALLCALSAAGLAVGLDIGGGLSGVFSGISYAVIPHVLLLAGLIYRYLRQETHPIRRIDPILATAIGFTFWFSLVPAVNLM